MELYLLIAVILAAMGVGTTLAVYRSKYKEYKKLFETEQLLMADLIDRNTQLGIVIERQYARLRELEADIIDESTVDGLVDLFNGLSDNGDDHGPN